MWESNVCIKCVHPALGTTCGQCFIYLFFFIFFFPFVVRFEICWNRKINRNDNNFIPRSMRARAQSHATQCTSHAAMHTYLRACILAHFNQAWNVCYWMSVSIASKCAYIPTNAQMHKCTYVLQCIFDDRGNRAAAWKCKAVQTKRVEWRRMNYK